ncbi:MAG: [protein-PII] uridylyltransferase [Inquilinaceae bacterium]
MLDFFTAPDTVGPVIEVPSATSVRDPRAIVDGDALARALTALADRHGADSPAFRPALLEMLRGALEDGRAEISRRFLDGRGTGAACLREQTYLMDRLLRALAEITVERVHPAANPTVGERLAMVAIGGYGRRELAPRSDLDLLFLLPYKRTPRAEQVVEYILYLLWDLGLKVGHAVRSVDECIRTARKDMTIRTSLLESRPLWGEQKLYESLRRRFVREVAHGTGAEFVAAKLAERDDRHRRLGDSRYVLEPNVKEGKGGLRDLQTLYWIGKYLYNVDDIGGLVAEGVLTEREAGRFSKAQNHLWTLRCHLHYLTGRAEERLTFDLQAEIGRRVGYTDRAGASGVERFMKHYFLIAKDVGNLTRIFCAALAIESQGRARRGLALLPFGRRTVDGFVREADWLTVAQDDQFRARPVDMIRLFHVAQTHDLDIHPTALKLITRSLRLIDPELCRDPEANRLFLDILTSPKNPETALRRMNEAGVLGRFVPDFGRVVAQMQYDMYHTYTVDEHTLLALGILHRIDSGAGAEQWPLATRVMRKISARRALYVALLLHDIAKGRGGDHSVLGASIARTLGPRFGLTKDETETASWLVRRHLSLSDAALKRDVDDDKTVQDLASAVESPERLRLLLLLTTADISAVGPGRWNAWKATLIQVLFTNTRDLMTGGLDLEGRGQRIRAAQDALRAELADWPAADIEAFIANAYPPYWLSNDGAGHARHATLIRAAQQAERPLTVDARVDTDRAVTEITIYTADHPGLFSRLAGAFAVCGANIVDARIFTMANGMALDVFSVQDATSGAAFDSASRLGRLTATVERSLAGKLKPLRELEDRRPAFASRTQAFTVTPEVVIENEASRTYTVIEVSGRDRPGLLYELTRALTDLHVQIAGAKIATYGVRAVDVFSVKDVFGLKITSKAKLAQIHDRLKAVLERDGDEDASADGG